MYHHNTSIMMMTYFFVCEQGEGGARGVHSVVKLNTTCETSLLPLYYMASVILNFMISISIYIFIVIILVQLCVILVRNGMVY